MDLGDTIEDDNEAFNQNNTKTMIFLRHHLHEELKIEYLIIKDPFFSLTKLERNKWSSNDSYSPKSSIRLDTFTIVGF